MSSFNRNSDCDLTQSPTAASAMTQPARRTFLPGHVVVIICSITIQLLNLARTIHLERYERSYNKTLFGFTIFQQPLLIWVYYGFQLHSVSGQWSTRVSNSQDAESWMLLYKDCYCQVPLPL